MSDREAFLAAIRDAPDDFGPYLVFADWLEETGQELDDLHAKMIRLSVDCELRTVAGQDVPKELHDAATLATCHYRSRLIDNPILDYGTLIAFRAGFIDHINCFSWAWEGGKNLFPNYPLDDPDAGGIHAEGFGKLVVACHPSPKVWYLDAVVSQEMQFPHGATASSQLFYLDSPTRFRAVREMLGQDEVRQDSISFSFPSRDYLEHTLSRWANELARRDAQLPPVT